MDCASCKHTFYTAEDYRDHLPCLEKKLVALEEPIVAVRKVLLAAGYCGDGNLADMVKRALQEARQAGGDEMGEVARALADANAVLPDGEEGTLAERIQKRISELEKQYKITKTQADGFGRKLQALAESAPVGLHPRLAQAQREALQSQLDELRGELAVPSPQLALFEQQKRIAELEMELQEARTTIDELAGNIDKLRKRVESVTSILLRGEALRALREWNAAASDRLVAGEQLSPVDAALWCELDEDAVLDADDIVPLLRALLSARTLPEFVTVALVDVLAKPEWRKLIETESANG